MALGRGRLSKYDSSFRSHKRRRKSCYMRTKRPPLRGRQKLKIGKKDLPLTSQSVTFRYVKSLNEAIIISRSTGKQPKSVHQGLAETHGKVFELVCLKRNGNSDPAGVPCLTSEIRQIQKFDNILWERLRKTGSHTLLVKVRTSTTIPDGT